MPSSDDEAATAEALRAGARGFSRRCEPLALGAASHHPLLASQLCRAAVELLPVQGAAIDVLFTADMPVPVGVSGEEAAAAEAVQFSAGHGPCWLSCQSGRVVVAEDLADPAEHAARAWPVFAARVADMTGYRSVVAVPLSIGRGVTACLVLYATARRVPWATSERASLGVVARAATQALAARALRGPTSARRDPAPAWLDSPSGDERREVWLAESAVMAATGADAASAQAALRGYALARGRSVDEVAADLNAQHLALEDLLAGR